jgi:hypothetical protein
MPRDPRATEIKWQATNRVALERAVQHRRSAS